MCNVTRAVGTLFSETSNWRQGLMSYFFATLIVLVGFGLILLLIVPLLSCVS